MDNIKSVRYNVVMDLKKQVRIYAILLIVVIFIAFGITTNRKVASEITWNILKLPKLILFIDTDADVAVKIGNYYFNVNNEGAYDLEKAKYYFNKALELDPNVSDAWHQLARINFLAGNFGDALLEINKQIEIHDDGLMSSYYIRGLIYGFMDEHEMAEKDFLIFAEWDKENWAVHNDLAWIYFKNGDYEKAEQISRKGLDFNPNNPWLLNSYGVSLMNTNKSASANVALLKALDEAQKLTPFEWQKAYPGNNPNVAKEGLENFIEAIEFNVNLLAGT